MEKPCVYAIRCPKTKKIRYVGHTHTPTIRFKSHLYKNKTPVGIWISELLSNGTPPIFEIIEQFDYIENKGVKDVCEMTGRISSRELYWIRHHSQNKNQLFNRQGNPFYHMINSVQPIIINRTLTPNT